jgi:thiol-disulfide isomerase/thioredoxin
MAFRSSVRRRTHGPTPYLGIAQNAGMRPSALPAVTRRRALGVAAAVGTSLCLPSRATAAHVIKPWPAARPVPELDLSDLDGKPWKLEAHACKVVVRNFWATWCEPCRVEMPSLAAMATKMKPQGLVVCAINYKDRPRRQADLDRGRRSRLGRHRRQGAARAAAGRAAQGLRVRARP